MKRIGAYEAKTRLSKLLDDVEAGETVEITKHGRAVALLSPVAARAKGDVARIIQQIREFRRMKSLRGLKIRALVEEGRRY